MKPLGPYVQTSRAKLYHHKVLYDAYLHFGNPITDLKWDLRGSVMKTSLDTRDLPMLWRRS